MRRGLKGKGLVPADGGFIALGGTSSRRQAQSAENEMSSGGVRKRPTGTTGGGGAIGGGSVSDDAMKRQREDPIGLFSNPLRIPSSSPTPISVPPAELCERILSEESRGNWHQVDGLLQGLINQLKTRMGKLEPVLFLSVLALAKAKPALFLRGHILNEFVGLLSTRKEVVVSKIKTAAHVPLLVANVLSHVLKDDRNWPESIVKAYIDDSLGERMWVDSEVCRNFIDNVLTSFGTRLPSSVHQSSTTAESGGGGGISVLSAGSVDLGGKGDGKTELTIDSSIPDARPKVLNRFCSPPVRHSIKTSVIQMVNDVLLNRISSEPSTARKTIRFLCDVTGIPEVRVAVIQRLEACLQNPKLTKVGQDLLMSICENCSTESPEDLETINHLVRIRVKSKPLATHYVACIKTMIQQNPSNIPLTMTYVIYNELSQSGRNPNNMAVISMLFQTIPKAATKALAGVFQDLLTRQEDFLKALRGLFREIVRVLRYEIEFVDFCRALMHDDHESPIRNEIHGIKDRYVVSVVDLITLAGLLSVSPTVREAASAYGRGDKKDLDVLRTFQKDMAEIQQESVYWLHTSVPNITRQLSKEVYTRCLRKLLFIESLDAYYAKDGWPAENERNTLFRLAGEVPLPEDIIMRVLTLGSRPEFPLLPQEALEVTDKIIRRAAMVHSKDLPTLSSITQVDALLDVIFRLCTYYYPEGIQLPLNYYPPVLAISKMYWKAWLILLTLAAFSPQTVGRLGWERYPILRTMMEMVMTNNYAFPPFGQSDEDRADELQRTRTERECILQFEQYLAQATTQQTITEQNSHLVNQLITLDPRGPARRFPSQVIDQLKGAAKRQMVGQWLCRSREPDFLLDIIQVQGTSKSMPWLVELVHSSAGSLDLLPLQCLCEFLLIDMTTFELASKRDAKAKRDQNIDQQRQLRARLHGLLFGAEAALSSTKKIMEYFLPKTYAGEREARQAAMRGLKLVLTESSDDEEAVGEPFDWLVHFLPRLPHFSTICESICSAFIQACKVETDLSALTAYFVFLSRYSLPDSLVSLSLDLARIIIKRAPHIGRMMKSSCRNDGLRALLRVFVSVLTSACEKQEKPNIEDREIIIVKWSETKRAYLHYSVIHGMIALLTHGPPSDGNETDYWKLLDAWFPENEPMPAGYLLETQQSALILDRALKLCMIRSSVPRLVKAALDSSQLDEAVIFVQSFGIPVQSMSFLLQKLDDAATSNRDALELAVNDNSDSPIYLSRLVDVERMRGAKGGDQFKAYLAVDRGPAVSKGSEAVRFDDEDIQKLPLPIPMDTESSGKEDETNWRETLQNFFKGNRKEQLRILGSIQKELRVGSSQQAKNIATAWLNLSKTKSISMTTDDVNESPAAARLFSLLKTRSRDDEIKDLVDHLTSLGGVEFSRRLRKPQRSLSVDSKDVLTRARRILRRGSSIDDWAAGPVVDELETLITAIDLAKDINLYLDILFGRNRLDCQSYLLSVVAHQSSWDTFHRAVEHLLASDALRRFKPSSVLEYLVACLQSPRIWQGTTPLATGIESFNKDPDSRVLLRVSPSQSCFVVDYVLTEAEESENERRDEILAKRLPLVQACCRTGSDVTERIVRHLQEHENRTSADSLLVQLYFEIPSIVRLFADLPYMSRKALYFRGSSKMDPKIHRLLATLSKTDRPEDAMRDLEGQFLLLQSIAACHPGLVARHLTLIGILLKGQVHLNAKEFQRRNLPLFFEWMLDLLDVLRSLLFQCLDCIAEPLNSILNTYFRFMKAYVTERQPHERIVVKFSAFLCRLHSSDPARTTQHLLAEMDTLKRVNHASFIIYLFMILGS
ncbi:integrator complex subunit 1-like [Oscarella lobularis]|uniref:integrator complex subunit 1-like n=1 Tax=Oscarella lobularis TaxID=121494 RepID=UPI003314192A